MTNKKTDLTQHLVRSVFALLSLFAFLGTFGWFNILATIAAVTGEPAQGLNQFRSQLYTAGIDFKSALKNFAFTADHIEETTGGPGVEYITTLILYFFKTTFTALSAAAVPISSFGKHISRHLFFTSLNPGSQHIR